MSDTVTIQKDIEVTVYEVRCDTCSSRLSFEISAGRGGDISIGVERCDCRDDRIEQRGIEEGKEEERSGHVCKEAEI